MLASDRVLEYKEAGMKNLERQTTLNLEELRVALENGSVGPRCLIINEIGVIFINSGGTEGGEDLLGLLESKSASDRMIAFCLLSTIPEKTKELSETLTTFRNDPQNQEFLESAEEMIAEFTS